MTATVDPALINALEQRGAREISHAGTSLLSHLVATSEILLATGANRDVCIAGLFHSVYGTARFAPSFDPPWTREELSRLIGHVAERLVFAFSNLSRFALGRAISPTGQPGFVLLEGSKKGQVLRVAERTYEALRQIADANSGSMRARDGTTAAASTQDADGFFQIPITQARNAPIVLFGIPSDAGSDKRGSRRGPALLRRATSALCFRSGTPDMLVDLERLSFPLARDEIADLGNVDVEGKSLEESIIAVEEFVATIPQSAVTMAIGGDHTFTLPILRARSKAHHYRLIHIDQHPDCQVWGDFSDDGPVTLDSVKHSTFISHVKADIPGLPITQVGVQSWLSLRAMSKEQRDFIATYLKRLSSRITDHQVETWEPSSILRALPAGEKVYVSIDVDVLRGSELSETAYPAATGVSYHQLVCVLEAIAQNNQIIGCDVMEFGRPDTSHRSSSARLLADLIARLLGLVVAQRGSPTGRCEPITGPA